MSHWINTKDIDRKCHSSLFRVMLEKNFRSPEIPQNALNDMKCAWLYDESFAVSYNMIPGIELYKKCFFNFSLSIL